MKRVIRANKSYDYHKYRIYDNGAMSQTGGDIVKVRVPFVISRAIYLKPEDFQ